MSKKETQKQRTTWLRWLLPAIVVAIGVMTAGITGTYQGKLQEVASNDQSDFLPASAESTEVSELQKKFSKTKALPAIVVYQRDNGITPADLAVIAEDVAYFKTIPEIGEQVSPPIPSQDGKAVEVIVQVSDMEFKGLDEVSKAANSHGSLAAYVTGPAAVAQDFMKAFEGIDGLLLLVAGSIVLLILIVVYRSPLLPVIVIVSVGLALGVASFVVYWLTKSGTIDLNGQSQGILSVLVFGAATDYALLLVARYREELHTHKHRFDAMRKAYRTTFLPILASGTTVIVSVLCLLLSDLGSNKGLGPVAAIGIAAAMLTSLTFLPAVLLLFGRVAFWPFRPKAGTLAHSDRNIWHKVAAFVGQRPRRIWIVATVCLLVFVAFLPQLHVGKVGDTDQILKQSEAVDGQAVLSRHFPGGSGAPTVVITNAAAAPAVAAATTKVEGVSSVRPVVDPATGQMLVVDGLVQLQATLNQPPASKEAQSIVKDVREVVHAVPGADALVGGYSSVRLDTNETARRDLLVIIPTVLAVIFVLLVLLLRAVVAPLVLVVSVVLSFAATLGLSALVFNYVLGYPGVEFGLPLFAFIFLVAFGIDYNIFLMTRVREESQSMGTRNGTLKALTVTGGVITSAGIVLAATFGALAVIPLLFLVQMGFIVAVGVLIDTVVVRSLLVPAAIVDIGKKSWWPSRLARDKEKPAP